MLELLLSGDRRQKGLFSQFSSEKLRVTANSNRVIGRVETDGDGPDIPDGAGSRGGGGGDRGEKRLSINLFGVMDGLDKIVELDETSAGDTGDGDSDADSVGSAALTGEQGDQQWRQMYGGSDETVGGGGGMGTIKMSRTLARAFFRTSGGGATITGGRGLTRAGSVRFSRRTSSGGSKGFYRDAGQLGEEDDWRTIAGSSPPSQTPRLPPEWTDSSALDVEPPQTLEPPNTISTTDGAAAPSGSLPLSSQPSTGGHGSGGGADGGAGHDSVRSGDSGDNIGDSSRGVHSGSRSGLSGGDGGGGGAGGGVGRSSSIYHSRTLSGSSDRDMSNHCRNNSNEAAVADMGSSTAEGEAATAAARERLLDRSTRSRPRSGSGAGTSWSSRLWPSSRRDGFSVLSGGGGREGGGASSLRIDGDGGSTRAGGDAPRLQLSDHGVR